MINKLIAILLVSCTLCVNNISKAEDNNNPESKKESQWYDTLKIGGYAQFRYNRLPSFKENDKLVNKQGDKTIGSGNGFSIRRARIKLSGDVHPHLYFYFQADFASSIGDKLHVSMLKDLYSDIYLDDSKEFRFRVGQSKVPFGFENLQSSQNRLSFDRSDSINSAVKDERDIGVFAYWASKEKRAIFKHLVSSGLKGSGDYGVVGVGVYNGQGANKLALSDDMHVIGHIAYPFKLGKQYLQLGIDGYMGKFYSKTDKTGNYKMSKGKMIDERVNVSLIVYPQPFGFQTEANYGRGASQGTTASAQNEIKSRNLVGGYAQAMYKIDDVIGTTSLIPYARATYYDGGKKFEDNAPHYKIKELELGLEWLLFKNLEVTAVYDMASRTSYGIEQKGHVTRLQAQINY